MKRGCGCKIGNNVGALHRSEHSPCFWGAKSHHGQDSPPEEVDSDWLSLRRMSSQMMEVKIHSDEEFIG